MPLGLIIGACSGLTSALLFYSAARGSLILGMLLVVLTPLPSLLAGLAWGWLPAAAGALAGACAMGLVADWAFAAGFALALGVPVCCATYLAYLSRPLAEGAREFYPVGHLVAALALYAGFLPLLVLPMIGSYDVLHPPLAEFYRQLAHRAAPELGLNALGEQELEQLARLTVFLLPGAFAAYWFAIFMLNLYLAGRILSASGRLGRDWPDLPALSLPPLFSLLLTVSVAAVFLPGVASVAGRSFTGGLLFAYLLAGLALLHYLARARAPWLLWLVYASLIVLGPYAACAITLGGLLEAPLKLRRRLGAQPPVP
jgi:Predicted membrane protein (DUF2232)